MPGGSEAIAISQYIRNVLASQSKRGLLFLMLGILLSALPIIRPVGSVIALVGAIWFFLGRGIFGEKHSKQVVRAGAIFVIGSALVLIGSIAYFLFVLSISGPSFPLYWEGNLLLAWALVPSLKSILAVEAIGAMLTGTAYAFFAHYLERPVERALMLVALAINIVISVLVYSVLSSDISSPLLSDSPSLLDAYRSGAIPEVAHAFENQVIIVSLLNLIPAVIYLIAYYTVFSRIKMEYPFD